MKICLAMLALVLVCSSARADTVDILFTNSQYNLQAQLTVTPIPSGTFIFEPDGDHFIAAGDGTVLDYLTAMTGTLNGDPISFTFDPPNPAWGASKGWGSFPAI